MSLEYDKYIRQREQLQAEVQATVIVPFTPEIYAKTEEEKIELKNAKARYKAIVQ